MKDNAGLVDSLKNRGRIESEKVEKAFRTTDRAVFVKDEYGNRAYQDRPLPINGEETISAPHMVAINTELLELEEDSRVAEVGSGSGYQAAILGQIAGEVIGVEIVEKLVTKSRERMEELGLENVEIIHGSDLEPAEGKFDRILYSCAISRGRFDKAKNRLSENGILVAPVITGKGQVMKKFKDGGITEHGRVRFVQFRD